jgi:hypothetical protein
MPDWTQHVRPRLSTLHLSPDREAKIVEEPRNIMPREFLDCSHINASGSQTRTERVTRDSKRSIITVGRFYRFAHDS